MANYNCTDSSNSAYGASNYGTCETTGVGAPNTGFFEGILGGGSFSILLPLAVAVIFVVVGAFIFRRRHSKR